ncbi:MULTISPECIES: LytTR family DNA-binding domain-containing protein [Dyella]|uniref:LytTR family transcriptional regulator n=2 Tax=Dyella TaxID=231454 RepID=A0A4R0YI64_9GAMM|nr:MULTISPECIES: LytTR family DNA-binding domain-containing protein [Dyella]TBR36787.1 LytTR family transcriptional regulator [Dyella terrae]TCI08122.1 LytTR family transcriptional regulator [Dyella soli]
MTESTGLTYESFKHWRRTFEAGFWLTLYTLNALFNSIVSQIDHPGTPAWQPWLWEWSSALMLLALVPAVVAFVRRWPFHFDSWRVALPVHLLASIPYSLIHVGGMVLIRTAVHGAMGEHYDFGPWWSTWAGYEYLKDVRGYFGVVALLSLYHLWVARLQGEARLLAEPEVGPPVEPVERPERFLVRKLGKEFLVNARDIEFLQAAGNYVNLHVRGREYPLRVTMAGIEDRLDPARFIRVHRSYAINLDFLAEIEPLDTGDARLRMKDGSEVPCSRRYRAQLKDRFGEAASVA